MSRKRHSY